MICLHPPLWRAGERRLFRHQQHEADQRRARPSRGDAALRHIAAVLRQNIRSSDIVGASAAMNLV